MNMIGKKEPTLKKRKKINTPYIFPFGLQMDNVFIETSQIFPIFIRYFHV